MQKATVVVIGGGATGVGILRDLSMRGVDALLIERDDLGYGTSSRYHGLLHSGGRYAVKDAEAARECIEENTILRRCVLLHFHLRLGGVCGHFRRDPNRTRDRRAGDDRWPRAGGPVA